MPWSVVLQHEVHSNAMKPKCVPEGLSPAPYFELKLPAGESDVSAALQPLAARILMCSVVQHATQDHVAKCEYLAGGFQDDVVFVDNYAPQHTLQTR